MLLQDEGNQLCRLKEGRSISSSLYYADYSKVPLLTHDGQNDLAAKIEIALSDQASLGSKLRQLVNLTTMLTAQPTNSELDIRLQFQSRELVDINSKVACMAKFAGNVAKRKRLTRATDLYLSAYTKRKRMCKMFLETMEDCSDGVINVKKCMSGQGQIEIEPDPQS
jgi:hypothetical protein